MKTNVLGILLILPTLAYAHAGAADAGFLHGFLHPLGGADHVLAMLAVGVLAAQRGGRALWLLPAAFMALMALGGFIASAGMAYGVGFLLATAFLHGIGIACVLVTRRIARTEARS